MTPVIGHPTLRLEGHLTAESLDAAFAALALPSGRTPLVVDCRAMTGYDAAARERFVDWNRAHRERLTRVAVLTDNRLWHMVISAMAMASGQPMKGFADPGAARAWVDDAAQR